MARSSHAEGQAFRDHIGCTGKQKFGSPKPARKRARLMGDKYGVPFEAYHCRECGHWHVGSVDPEQRKRRRSWRPPSR